MTIFASYLELAHKFSNYGKRADLSENGEEMTTLASYLEFTQKRSFVQYIILNYVKNTVLTQNGITLTIFALSLEVTQKRRLAY